MRHAFTFAGIALLAASTHATIEAAGGYVGSRWVMPVAIAFGIAAAAAMTGCAWREDRKALAVLAGLSLLSAEAFGLIASGELIIANRDAASVPYREATTRHREAKSAYDALMAQIPTSTRRLATAEATLAAANEAVLAKASEKSCAAHCRALLDQQVSAASTERDVARAEFEKERSAVLAAAAAASSRLAVTPLPARRNDLASELGMRPTTLNLTHAALGAIGINLLASVLIAFGTHRKAAAAKSPDAASARSSEAKTAFKVLAVTSEAPDARTMVGTFASQALMVRKTARVLPDDLWRSFDVWRVRNGLPEIDATAFAIALADEFRPRGVRKAGDHLVGIGLRKTA